jgi:hypothetical protein
MRIQFALQVLEMHLDAPRNDYHSLGDLLLNVSRSRSTMGEEAPASCDIDALGDCRSACHARQAPVDQSAQATNTGCPTRGL